jgi:hypothetical protein
VTGATIGNPAPGIGTPYFGNFLPTPRVTLQLRLRRGVRGRRMAMGVVAGPMYDVVLRASAPLLSLPPKVLFIPSCNCMVIYSLWALYDHHCGETKTPGTSSAKVGVVFGGVTYEKLSNQVIADWVHCQTCLTLRGGPEVQRPCNPDFS